MLRSTLARVRFSSLALMTTLTTLLVTLPARAATFSFVEPTRISAGAFYNGTTLRVRGSVGERSQVVVRVMGESSPETFDRQDRIGGFIWGGVEHVTFRQAPSVYGLFTSTALAATANRSVREQLRLGYEALVPHIEVVGARADKNRQANLSRRFIDRAR